MSIYDFEVKDGDGNPVSLSQYKDNVLLKPWTSALQRRRSNQLSYYPKFQTWWGYVDLNHRPRHEQ